MWFPSARLDNWVVDPGVVAELAKVNTDGGVHVVLSAARLAAVLGCSDALSQADRVVARSYRSGVDFLVGQVAGPVFRASPYTYVPVAAMQPEGAGAVPKAGTPNTPGTWSTSMRKAIQEHTPTDLVEYIQLYLCWLVGAGGRDPMLLHAGVMHLRNIITVAGQGKDFHKYDEHVRLNLDAGGNEIRSYEVFANMDRAYVDRMPVLHRAQSQHHKHHGQHRRSLSGAGAGAGAGTSASTGGAGAVAGAGAGSINAPCNYFNKGANLCPFAQCKFKHMCSSCKETGHGAYECKSGKQ